jgi:hypothetical protein
VTNTGFGKLAHAVLPPPVPVLDDEDDDDEEDDEEEDDEEDDELVDDPPPAPLPGGRSGRIPDTSPVTREASNGSHWDSVQALRN